MAGRCNASQNAQDAWDAGDASLASGRNADGSDAGSVFADVYEVISLNLGLFFYPLLVELEKSGSLLVF